MKHYEIAEWLDFARGVGDQRVRSAMARHVREGCQRCGAIASGLERLGSALAADARFEPPADVVRCARAVFSRFQPAQVVGLPRLLSRLVQDSLNQPLPVGVRGTARASRRALFQAGELFVDLRLEQRPGQPGVTLVGQLLSPDPKGAGAPRRPVVLTSGRRVVWTTATNDHGEFEFEYLPAGQMRLHIPVDEGARRLEISLNGLMPRAGRREGEAGRSRRDE
jgi:hypothetical protein